jgi:hypothetical protein
MNGNGAPWSNEGGLILRFLDRSLRKVPRVRKGAVLNAAMGMESGPLVL